MISDAALRAAFRRGFAAGLKGAGAGEPWAESDPALPRLESVAIGYVVGRWRRLRDEVLDLLGLGPTGAKAVVAERFAFSPEELVAIISRGNAFAAEAAGPDGPLIRAFLAAWARGWANAGTELEQADEVAQALTAVRAEIAQRGLELVRDGTARTLRERIVAELAGGAYDGMNPVNVARALRQRFGAQEYNWERLARTEIAQAQSEGKRRHYLEAGIELVDYVTAQDDRVSEICQTLAARGPYAVANAPVPGRDSHPNCFPGTTRVVASGLQASTQRWYAGDVVELRTASGQLVTVTPNHPILTWRGWIPAQAIVQGDHVVRCIVPERVMAQVDPNHDHAEARIDQVAEALGGTGAVAAMRVPLAAEDFHGDGPQHDVDVIRPDSALKLDRETAARRDPVGELALLPVHADLSRLARRGTAAEPLEGVSASAAGLMRGRRERTALLRIGAGHASAHAGAAVPRLDALAQQEPADRWAADAEGFGERLLALAGLVSLDEVLGVRKLDFAGHVYNLETATGWYIANGIVAHNCRCTLVARIPD